MLASFIDDAIALSITQASSRRIKNTEYLIIETDKKIKYLKDILNLPTDKLIKEIKNNEHSNQNKNN